MEFLAAVWDELDDSELCSEVQRVLGRMRSRLDALEAQADRTELQVSRQEHQLGRLDRAVIALDRRIGRLEHPAFDRLHRVLGESERSLIEQIRDRRAG
jgi:uncharacterized coiled-coil protein SlyX